MLLDNLIADYLIKKNISVRLIKRGLRAFYLLINIALYFNVFYKMYRTWAGLAIFLLVAIPFDYVRSVYLNRYIKNRGATQ